MDSKKWIHPDKLPKSADINFTVGCLHCGATHTELYNGVCNAGCPDEGADEQHRICKPTPGEWRNNGGQIEAIVREDIPPIVVAIVGEVNNQTRKDTANARLIAAAPLQNAALHEAAKLIDIARQYFPKSMHNSDKFQLEQTCAAIGTAIATAEKGD